MYKYSLAVLIVFLSSNSFSQTNKDLDVDVMLRGAMYVSSSIDDKQAIGGFGGSGNSAQEITDSFPFHEKGVFLKIDTTLLVTWYENSNGYHFYVVNKSDSVLKLGASDSRISCIAEVYYKGEWRPIEYLASSWCGNSYHQVYLKQNEYWELTVPKFTGKEKVKLRYKLIIGKNSAIYSNEIMASVNKGQFETKQGHEPTGIMDPYED